MMPISIWLVLRRADLLAAASPLWGRHLNGGKSRRLPKTDPSGLDPPFSHSLEGEHPSGTTGRIEELDVKRSCEQANAENHSTLSSLASFTPFKRAHDAAVPASCA